MYLLEFSKIVLFSPKSSEYFNELILLKRLLNNLLL